MKIAISAKANNMESEVDPRFGRCNFFLLVDTETMEFEAISNQAGQAMGGAGVKAAQLVIDSGAEAVISGNFGPNAFQTLSAANVKLYNGAQGTIKDTVEKYKKGELKESGNSTVPPHFGLR
jgi:predicted Fe-Mo cluster-binding NifX family protein